MLFHLIHAPYWLVLGMGVLLFLTVIFGDVGDEEVELEGDADPLEVDRSRRGHPISDNFALVGGGESAPHSLARLGL